MAKLGYSFKKYVLSNLRKELFADNIKDYIKKNKEMENNIIQAKNNQLTSKQNYLISKNQNSDLRKKYILLSNILSETKKAFTSSNKIDKNKIKMVLSYVVKGIDLDNQKFSILAQKSQKAIQDIISNDWKNENNEVLNSEVKNGVNEKNVSVTVSNRRPNIQNNGGYGRSNSTLKENDGTDEMNEMVIELKKLLIPKY
jgi:hypothetical protein